MHIVITGGAGFIGSHLTDHLIRAGDNVTVLDDFSTGNRMNLANVGGHRHFRLVQGSVLDARLVQQVVARADVVFHLAAAVGVHRILEDPLGSLEVNLHGTENVLHAALVGEAVMVLASTSEVYGKNAADALNEQSDRIYGDPLLSRWSYAEAKAIDEAFAHAYWREKGLQVSIARLFNTVGERQTGRYGMVVPNLVGQALRNEPLTVFGDGQQTRCFSYVGDIVPALISLAENNATRGQAFNLGGDHEISILNLASRIIDATHSQSVITLVPYEQAYGQGYEDMRRRVPDNRKAREVLGFNPRTGIYEIIEAVADGLRGSIHVPA